MGIGINIPIEKELPPIGAPYHNDDPCPIKDGKETDKEAEAVCDMLFDYGSIEALVKTLGGKG